MKKKNRLAAMLLALAMAVSVLCVPADAFTIISGEVEVTERPDLTATDEELVDIIPGYYDESGQFYPDDYDAAAQAEVDKLIFTSGSRNAPESTGILGSPKNTYQMDKITEYGVDDSVKWELKDGILTLSGDGIGYSYVYKPNGLYSTPFQGNQYIETIIVEKGVSLYIPFQELPNLRTMILMDVDDTQALALDCPSLDNIIIGANLQDTPLSCVSIEACICGGKYTYMKYGKTTPDTAANLVFLSSAINNDLADQAAEAKSIISGLDLPDSALSKLPSNIGGTAAAVTLGTSVNLPVNLEYDSWAKEYIQKAYDLGLVNYTTLATYKLPIDRIHFCVLANNLYKKLSSDMTDNRTDGVKFKDVNFTYTDEEIAAVYNMNYHGVIDGYGNGEFGSSDDLTREQASKILANLAELVGVKTQAVTTPFTDMNTASSWAQSTIAKVYGIGVMNGTSATSFSPKATYTRQQSIVTMVRLYEAATK